MKLSIYLLQDTITSFEDALQTKYLTGPHQYVRLEPNGPLPYECVAYVQRSQPTTPRWAVFLQPGFPIGELKLENRTSSFVLLMRVQNRCLAATFGMGFQAIDRSKLEPRFGLMVAANTVNPTAVSTLESTLIDSTGRQRRTHVTEGAPFTDFEIDPNVDCIRRLSGKLLDDSIAKSITGTDAASVNVTCDLTKLDHVCSKLIERFESDDYKTHFAHIDKLTPLAKSNPAVVGLNAELEAALVSGEGKIALSLPDGVDEDLVSHYILSYKHHRKETEHLSLAAIRRFIEEAQAFEALTKVTIVGVGDNDIAVTKRRPLAEYLVGELAHEDHLYIHCHGHWHAAEHDFVQQVRSEVSQLPDLTAGLDLPRMDEGESEGIYNVRTGADKGWLVMDKKNFQLPRSADKIEICDLLTPARELICVKKMSSSSALSHLFAQGSVSATLLRTMTDYRQKLESIAQSEWATFGELAETDVPTATIVYAMATTKDGPLYDSMFFFSQVNLLSHVRTVRQFCKVGLCKIIVDEAPARLRPAAKKRNSNRIKKTSLAK